MASPFPSDRFTVPDRRRSRTCESTCRRADCAALPSDCLDVALLNQLDGFNTQPRISIPVDGAIDPATATSETIFIVRLGELSDPSTVYRQIIGINQVVWDLATLTLFVQSDQRLDQHTTYVLIVTNGVRDADGDPIEPADTLAISAVISTSARPKTLG